MINLKKTSMLLIGTLSILGANASTKDVVDNGKGNSESVIIENSFDQSPDETVTVRLMCLHQREADYRQVYEIEPGEQTIWVTALIEQRRFDSQRTFTAKMNANLTSEDGYRIAYKRNENEMSFWLEDRATGERVSSVESGNMHQPPASMYSLRRRQCESSSV